jgi:hypothetical protein
MKRLGEALVLLLGFGLLLSLFRTAYYLILPVFQ